MVENLSNFTQEVVLPSKGLLNPEIPEGKITQRCLMVADQKYLSGSSQSAGSSLNQIIQRTVTSPESFDVSKLTMADSLYLLFKLRILSYGNSYKFRTRCPECGRKIDIIIDMSELPVETLEDDYAEKLVIKLPHRGDTVYTKILTNEESEEITKEIKRRKKRNAEDESTYVLRIARSIKKVELSTPNSDGKKELTSFIDIERYVNALTDLDASAILFARESVSYGINTVTEQICPECREIIDVSVQFSSEFFRPNLSRR